MNIHNNTTTNIDEVNLDFLERYGLDLIENDVPPEFDVHNLSESDLAYPEAARQHSAATMHLEEPPEDNSPPEGYDSWYIDEVSREDAAGREYARSLSIADSLFGEQAQTD